MRRLKPHRGRSAPFKLGQISAENSAVRLDWPAACSVVWRLHILGASHMDPQRSRPYPSLVEALRLLPNIRPVYERHRWARPSTKPLFRQTAPALSMEYRLLCYSIPKAWLRSSSLDSGEEFVGKGRSRRSKERSGERPRSRSIDCTPACRPHRHRASADLVPDPRRG